MHGDLYGSDCWGAVTPVQFSLGTLHEAQEYAQLLHCLELVCLESLMEGGPTRGLLHSLRQLLVTAQTATPPRWVQRVKTEITPPRWVQRVKTETTPPRWVQRVKTETTPPWWVQRVKTETTPPRWVQRVKTETTPPRWVQRVKIETK